MKVIFVIGGMGSGKSAVGRCFAGLGVPVLDLDKVGHTVLRAREVREALVEAFGEGILDDRGEIDRKALAIHAFPVREGVDALALITHPAILAELQRWLGSKEEEGNDFGVVEVSAFGDDKKPYAAIPDYLIAVCAPLEKRIKRALAKGFDEKDVRERIARQPKDDQWRAWADFTIENDRNRAHLKAQVEDIWKTITHTQYSSGEA